MPSETETLVGAAHEALDSGDWSTARVWFEAALEQEQTAEALSGLGDTLGWLGETQDAVRCFERAYAIFYKRPDPAQASVAAISLYLLCRVSLGNVAASRGWLARAVRLADEFDLGARWCSDARPRRRDSQLGRRTPSSSMWASMSPGSS